MQTIQAGTISHEDLQKRTSASDVREDPAFSERIGASPLDDAGQIATETPHEGVYRVKYHPSYKRHRWMVVEGTLGHGRTYPVILDTGATPALCINDVHLLEGRLASQLLAAGDSPVRLGGTCSLPKLQIADLTLLNWPCHYAAQRSGTSFFGSCGDKPIIAGVPTLRRFRYILFDNVTREVEFSVRETFECPQPQRWSQHPFVIEEDFGGNAFLFVEIPVAGKPARLQLDTGSGRGMAISEQLWEEIRRRAEPVSLHKTKELYPYIGRLDCRRGVIPRLRIGGRIVSRAEVSVFPDDSPLLEQSAGMLGMQCFRGTVLVLDFQRNQMWVKDTSSG